MKKRGFIIAFIIIAILLSGAYGVGTYFVNYALSPASESDQRVVDEEDEIKLTGDVQQQIDDNADAEFIKGVDFENKTRPMIVSQDDSLRLKGQYLDHDNVHQWVILIHGYKSSNENMMSYGATYYEHGYNVVLPDNRAHGKSDGEYIGMGWLDKDDIACWVNWIIEKDNQAQIILHGVSMGGATVMMASGDHLPHVVGYIEDCGYTSVWDVFQYHIPMEKWQSEIALHMASVVTRIRAGYALEDVSPLKQVQKSQVPILFIHGSEDDFVPCEMVNTLYQSATCPKEKLIIEGAGHAQSCSTDSKTYYSTIFQFIERYTKK